MRPILLKKLFSFPLSFQALMVFMWLGGSGAEDALASPPKEPVRIAAIVNQDVITEKDLLDRLRLVVLSSGLPDTPETQKKLTHQVLKTLIEEKLQLAEMKATGIFIPEEEIKLALENLEKQNNMPQGSLDKFLKDHKIPRKTLEDQAKAQIGWGHYIRATFPHEFQIEERSIDTMVEEMAEGADQPHYLLSEIFLAVESPQQEEITQKNAYNLFEQLRQGAPFPFLAHQFSQSASAANGGDIGWIREDQLDPSLKKALEGAQPVIVTTPIRTQNGYYIIALRDKKTMNSEEKEGDVFTFKHVRVDVGSRPSSASLKEKEKALDRLRHRARSCEALDLLAKSTINGKVREFEDLTEEDVPPSIFKLLSTLEEGTLSPSLLENGSLNCFMICKRRHRDSEEARRDLALRQLQRDKMTSLSTRLLRDMKQNAYIDIRV